MIGDIADKLMNSGTSKSRYRRQQFSIPNRLNIVLTVLVIVLSVWCLYYTANTDSVAGMIFVAILFSFVMQTGFSLLHEAEHNKLHRSQRVNDILGFLLATLFPASYRLLKEAHLNHHKMNRSDAELVDYYTPSDNRTVKTILYYSLISGLIWMAAPVMTLLVALLPSRLTEQRPDKKNTSATDKYMPFIQKAGSRNVTRETIAVLIIWVFLWNTLQLDWLSLSLCYAAFAFSWSSQQYIYHVRTPRHLIEGAYDLSLFAPLQWLYLNFNFHLQHHRAVNVPWIYMHNMNAATPERKYLSTYLKLWSPPQSVEKAWPVEFQRRGPLTPKSTESAISEY